MSKEDTSGIEKAGSHQSQLENLKRNADNGFYELVIEGTTEELKRKYPHLCRDLLKQAGRERLLLLDLQRIYKLSPWEETSKMMTYVCMLTDGKEVNLDKLYEFDEYPLFSL